MHFYCRHYDHIPKIAVSKANRSASLAQPRKRNKHPALLLIHTISFVRPFYQNNVLRSNNNNNDAKKVMFSTLKSMLDVVIIIIKPLFI